VEQSSRIGNVPALGVNSEERVLDERVAVEPDLDGEPVASPPVVERSA
jgi:hypothetical protein